MKYSAMAQPANGAMYCIGAGSAADATTTMPYSSAPCSFNRSTTRAPHLVPLAQHQIVAEDDGADVVLFEVERLAGHLLAGLRGGELEHLARHGGREAVDAGDPVLHLQHRADLADVDFGQIGGLDFLEEDLFQLAGSQDGISGHGSTVGRL